MNILEEFIQNHDLLSKGVKLHSFESSTHTAEEAAELLGCDLAQIVKSIIIIVETTEKNVPMLVVVPGTKKLRQQAVRKLLKNNLQMFGIKDSRLATKDEVLNLTGYQVGGVPPISLDLQCLSDISIRDQQVVYGGGGLATMIVEIPTNTLFQLINPIFGEICSNL